VACYWASVFGAYLLRTKCRGRVWYPEAAPDASWWWLVVVGDLDWPRAHVWTYLMAEVQRRFVGVQHGVGGGWQLLRVASALRLPPEDLTPSGRCRFSRELGKVSRLSCRLSSVWLRGA
jgi:hypothetical protein